MRKLLFSLIALLLCLTPLALAQRGHNGDARPQNRHEARRSEPREHRDHVRENRREYRGDRHERNDARNHRDGRRFDHDYFRGHFGREHSFYWSHCRWYGPRFYLGSRFYYSGVWFVIVDPIPDYWGDEVIYVEDIDGVYYIINPMYPDTRIVVDVTF
jgi:Ni/Co efflux regulator RcnB